MAVANVDPRTLALRNAMVELMHAPQWETYCGLLEKEEKRAMENLLATPNEYWRGYVHALRWTCYMPQKLAKEIHG